jgi:hypothetical protein
MPDTSTLNRWWENARAAWAGSWNSFRRRPVTVNAPSARDARPRGDDERTGAQRDPWGNPAYGGGVGYVAANLPGHADAPPGTEEVYRAMDADPVVAAVQSRLVGKVGSAPWSVRSKEGTEDARVKTVQQALTPLWPDLIACLVYATSMGRSAFEVVWERRPIDVGADASEADEENADNSDDAGAQAKAVRRVIERRIPVKFKYLLPEITTPLVDARGEVVGLRQTDPATARDIDLYGANKLYFVFDAVRGGIYGRSLHENIRVSAWWPWVQAIATGTAIDARPAGRQFTVKGPPGGEEKAREIAEALKLGKSVFMENFLAALAPDKVRAMTPDQIKALAGVSAFQIDQYDLMDFGPASEANREKLRALDDYKCLGWHESPRAVLEGRHGTKAEAESHAAEGNAFKNRLYADICGALSRGPVNDILRENFGPGAADTVWLEAGPIGDVHAEADWKFIDAALADPGVRGQLLRQVDIDAIVDRRGIPKLEGVIILEEPEPQPRPDPFGGMSDDDDDDESPPAGVNGNGGNGRLAELEPTN